MVDKQTPKSRRGSKHKSSRKGSKKSSSLSFSAESLEETLQTAQRPALNVRAASYGAPQGALPYSRPIDAASGYALNSPTNTAIPPNSPYGMLPSPGFVPARASNYPSNSAISPSSPYAISPSSSFALARANSLPQYQDARYFNTTAESPPQLASAYRQDYTGAMPRHETPSSSSSSQWYSNDQYDQCYGYSTAADELVLSNATSNNYNVQQAQGQEPAYIVRSAPYALLPHQR
jgi:hypothetical protein